jgi:flavin reductase (DIM6/NTAB) family NADH-FMN oxidoreductase RutF
MDTVAVGGRSQELAGKGIDPHQIRAVCSRFVTGVTIVTSIADGQPVGLTINSFTSVSLEPPLVLFCLHQRSGVREVLRGASAFVINILAEDQEHLSRAFATREPHSFTEIQSQRGVTGAPIMSEALAYLDCRPVAEQNAGDHVIILGEVMDLGVLREESGPLTFFRSTHGRLQEIA